MVSINIRLKANHRFKEGTQNHNGNSNKNPEMEPLQPVQINIDQSKTYRKVLSWLQFDDENFD